MSDLPKDTLSEVSIQFQSAHDYRVYPANGAWGGMTPQGDFALDFYVERNVSPTLVVHKMKNGTELGEEIRREPADIHISRLVQVGVVMSPVQAFAVATFIMTKLKDAKLVESINGPEK